MERLSDSIRSDGARLQPVYNMVPTCSTPSAVNSTAALRAVLGTTATNGGINFGTSDLQCTSQAGAWPRQPPAANRTVRFCVRVCVAACPGFRGL